MTPVPRPGRRSLLFAFLVVVAGGLVLGGRWGGTVPYLTPDTINDAKFIQDCCVFQGIGTSVGTMVHGGNWLHMKALAQWAGIGDVPQHWILHLLLALALGCTVLVGSRVRGIGTGLLAVVLVLAIYRLTQDFRLDMTYNHRPLPLLGMMFAMFALLAVESGHRSWLVLAGVCAALATNIHTQAILLLPSLLWVALLVVPGRFVSLAVAALSFGAFAFLTSPGSWIHNIANFGAGGRFSAPVERTAANPVLLLSVASAAGLSILAWRTFRDPSSDRTRRGHVMVLLATVLPRVGGFLVLVVAGAITSADKYLVDAMPAVALGLAWSLAEGAAFLGRRLGLRRPALPGFPIWASLATAVLLSVWPPFERLGRSHDGLPVPVGEDVEALHRYLAQDRGWNAMHMVRHLKGPRDLDLLDAMITFHPEDWGPEVPGDASAAIAIKVDAPALPDPLPAGWRVLNRERNAALLVVPTESWLDWGRFEVCEGPLDSPDETLSCRPGGIAATRPVGARVEVVADAMPVADPRRQARLVLKIPVSDPAARGEHEIFMPRITDRCGGLVAAVEGEGLRRSPDGRRAWISAPEGVGAKGLLTVEFHPGAEECRGWSYAGFPPFFVEADAATVAAFERLLDAQAIVVAALRKEGAP